jgi:hypothetical protein
MPAGLVEYHYHVLVPADRLGEAVEEHLHCLAAYREQHQGEIIVGVGSTAAKMEANVKRLSHRPGGRSPRFQQTDRRGLSAHPRFVLEKQVNALVFYAYAEIV